MKWLARALLLGASALACVAMLEVALRFAPTLAPPPNEWVYCQDPRERMQFHPEFGFVGVAHARYFERQSVPDGWTLIQNDSEGFRDGFDRGERHVPVLGDSFARGTLVEEAQSVPGLLDRWNEGVAFHNFGIPGYGPREVYAVYRAMAPRYDHELVVLLYYFGNDLTDAGDGSLWRPHFRRGADGGVEPVAGTPAPTREPGPPTLRKRVGEWLRSYSRIHSLVMTRVMLRRNHLKGPTQVGPALAMTRMLLGAVADTAEQHGARLLIVSVPDYEELGDPSTQTLRQRELLERLARERESVELIDLEALLLDAGAENHYGLVDKHFNARGYHLAARTIHDWIEHEGPRVLRAGRPAPSFQPSATAWPEPDCGALLAAPTAQR